MSEPWKIVTSSDDCPFDTGCEELGTHWCVRYQVKCSMDTCPLKSPAPQEIERLVDELIESASRKYRPVKSIEESDVKLTRIEQAKAVLLAACGGK